MCYWDLRSFKYFKGLIGIILDANLGWPIMGSRDLLTYLKPCTTYVAISICICKKIIDLEGKVDIGVYFGNNEKKC